MNNKTYLRENLYIMQTYRRSKIVLSAGKGFMIGMKLNFKGDKIVEKYLKQGLLINRANENILRFLPPLIVTKKEVAICINILDKVFQRQEF